MRQIGERMTDTRQAVYRIGVVADTHIPDRAGALHPALLSTLAEARVDLICHCGDICIPSVLADLEKVAPVEAVRGNRDVLFRKTLPLVRMLTIHGVKIVLTHGHFGWKQYWRDKLQHLTVGYRLERYQRFMETHWPDADVYLFGHTHHAEIVRYNTHLILNPGSASVPPRAHPQTTIGLIEIGVDRTVGGKIVVLKGAV